MILVGLFLEALLVTTLTIIMIRVVICTSKKPKPDETKGPFTRPTHPANPGVARTSREPNHTHMQSGTIYENRNPENEGSYVYNSFIRTNLRMRPQENDPFEAVRRSFNEATSMYDRSRSIHEALIGQSPAAPGVIVRVTTTEETLQHPDTSPERIVHEQSVLADMLKARQNSEKAPPPEVKRVSRYKRKPVI